MTEHPQPETLEIDVKEAARLRSEAPGTLFLDVREPEELDLCRIDGACHIPMARVPDAVESLPRDRDLIVFCHHGMRSLSVVNYLRQHGFARARNLRGGIDAWSVAVDPRVPRYG